MKRLVFGGFGIAACLFVVAVVFAAPGGTVSDDFVKISPEKYKVLLDTDRVRMLEYHLKPGETEAMHTHHRLATVYYLTAATLEETPQDGAPRSVSVKAGDVGSRQANYTHSLKNTGRTELASVVFELKDGPKK